MKILYISPTFYPALRLGGGVPRVAYELSHELKRQGHEVTVFTTDKYQKSDLPKNVPLDIEGINTYYFKVSSNFLSKNKFYTTPALIKITKKEIQNFDIIHLHDFRTFQNVIVCHYAKKYGIPYVLQVHGSLLRIIEKQKLKNLFDLFWGHKILREASKVVALSHSEAEAYTMMGVSNDKIEILPNGVNLSKFSNLPERGEFRKKYSIQDNKKIVLYLGRLHESKSIDLLLEAFSEVSRELVDSLLVLTGPDGGYKSPLERDVDIKKIREKVIFTGTVSEKEKIAIFVDVDVFVTPSFYGFPLTFVEACACGLPIITTNKGDKLDWIHNKVGYVVGYNKHQLQVAISKILTDEKLRKRFGEEGKRLVREEFNWSQIARKLEKIYLNLCTQSKFGKMSKK